MLQRGRERWGLRCVFGQVKSCHGQSFEAGQFYNALQEKNADVQKDGSHGTTRGVAGSLHYTLENERDNKGVQGKAEAAPRLAREKAPHKAQVVIVGLQGLVINACDGTEHRA